MFKKQKFSFSVLRSSCLMFCQFQPGVACKSVAYNKSMYFLSNYFVSSIIIKTSCKLINPSLPSGPFRYSLKTPENLLFTDILGGYRTESLG